jgi:hypothetical protein
MRDIGYIIRSCPTCGTQPSGKLSIYTDTKAENSELEILRKCWMGFFKEKTIFSYSRCQCCGLLYAPVFFNVEQLRSLYSQMPPNMDVVPLEALRKTQNGYFSSLEKRLPLTGSYIEIGPDIGLFTENCRKHGSFDKYWLFEPNIDVLTQLTALMNGVEHNVIHELFNFSYVPDHSVGAVVMVHVLDHLLDPLSTLKELHSKMHKNAILLIVTHDEGSLLAKIFRKNWPAYCLQHPQLYNALSIQSLLKKSNFKLLEQTKTVNHFPVAFLLKHLLWGMGIRVKKLPFFGNAVVGLKLGNIMTLAVKSG